MSNDLTSKSCSPCQGGIPTLSQDEALTFLGQTNGWRLEDKGHHIFRRFEFGNFVAAMAFVSKVGEIAEEEGHHPDINFGWGYAEITIFSHEIDGLHENDFILAAKINQI